MTAPGSVRHGVLGPTEQIPTGMIPLSIPTAQHPVPSETRRNARCDSIAQFLAAGTAPFGCRTYSTHQVVSVDREIAVLIQKGAALFLEPKEGNVVPEFPSTRF